MADFEEHSARNRPLKIKELIGALEKRGVDYLIVGGWALVAHGLVRATKDIDICPQPTEENYERLLLALGDINGEPILGDLGADHDIKLDMEGLLQGGNWLVLTEYGRLDLMQDLSGPKDSRWGWDELNKKSVAKNLLGFKCKFCGYEDLLALKRAAGRPQDLLDVEAIQEAQR